MSDIKLLGLYQSKGNWDDEFTISDGIWEAYGVDTAENKDDDIWTMRCVLPFNDKVKRFEERKVSAVIVKHSCERVRIMTDAQLDEKLERAFDAARKVHPPDIGRADKLDYPIYKTYADYRKQI